VKHVGWTRARPALGSAVFFALAPGVMAGVMPWALTGWHVRHWWLPVRIAGAVLILVGVPILVNAFVRFVVEGLGTPAPVAPPKQLVVGGLYRYVRNPMYLAVAATIIGEALLLGRPVLFVWAAVFAVAVWSFVRLYEEPTLSRLFGAEYDDYRRTVPGWWPRLRRRAERGAR
jgi:protein-S-isoprenylcysteine O-methyltransferase Ste14